MQTPNSKPNFEVSRDKKVCCVKDCPAKDAEDVTYFSLPVNVERRLQWLKLIGITELYNELHNPRDPAVCSIHFEESQITVLKQALPTAIPTRHVPRKRKGESIFSSNTASQTDFSSSEEDDDDDGCEINNDNEKVIVYKRIKPNRKMFVCSEIDCDDRRFYDDEIDEEPSFSLCYSENEPRDSIALGNRKIFAFYEDGNTEVSENNMNDTLPTDEVTSKCNMPNNVRNNILPVITNVVSLQNPILIFEKFLKWRHRTIDRQKGPKYDKDFKIFALNLHTINTRAYRMLMDTWQLPKEKELKDIQLKIGPRLDEQMMILLEQKFKLLSNKAKFCTLGLYAMPLKPHFYYDPANDDIIGVHNVNGDKKNMAATYALIAMIRGLMVPWHQPLAYSFFSTMTEVDDIELFLRDIIGKLKKLGLKVLGVVMGSDDFFWKYCRSKHFISVTKPYLRIGTSKLYVVFDILHVLNMFKEEFLESDYMFENEKISGNYVKLVYDMDKEKGGRMLSKLTDEHMKVGKEEKNVEYSLQVFSKAVCGAISFYKDHGLIDEEVTPTVNFIKKINEVFDVLISEGKNKDKTKLATAQNKALDNGLSVFKKLAKVIDFDTDSAIQDADSIKYFLVSFKSLCFISCVLKDAHQNGMIQSRFCNLDPMLQFIKLIKKDANTNKPSAIKFTGCFSKLFIKYLVDLTPAPKSIGNMDNFLKMADSVKDCYEVYCGDRIRLKDNDYRFTLPDTYAIIYVSSYLLFKCSMFHTCKVFVEFMKRMVDLNKTKVYVHFENYNTEAAFYGKLKLPPIELPAYVERLDKYFVTCFNDYFHTNPAEMIFRALKNVPSWKMPCPCFPNEYMLKLFVRTRMYETILHNTKCLKNVSFDPPYSLEAKQL
ncbi:uncharacterized protein LOC133532794 isoform X1 [Cydia pomonella]|uniref:uncharacterized protein LOC133532794 isoform X1 n=1 Tax=Cydia pomonella TaxID=82600 RepID=UPI002ADE09DB|nr:uncharacterized protein LOC133532794 isoform X1 [Cydia pomonella]